MSRTARPRQAPRDRRSGDAPLTARTGATSETPAPDTRRWLLALVAGVLVLKIALAVTLAGHPLLQPEGELDAGEYWRLATRVAGGDVWLTGTPFYLSPLYTYSLALAQVLTGARVTGGLVLQALLGTIAVWLTARTAGMWAGDAMRTRASLVAGAALGLTGIVALQEALILQSALDGVLMSACAYAFSRAMLQPSARRWVWCGVSLAALAANRPNAWLLAPIMLPAAWRFAYDSGSEARGTPWMGPVAFVAGALLVLTPFAVRTGVATGEWQLLPSHGGLNLYIGNHAAANGTYTVVDDIRPSIDGQREDTRRVAERATGRSLSNSEVSSYFVRRSLAWWRDTPTNAARLLAYKLWLTTHAWELPVNVSYAWFREQVLLLKLLPIGAWLLIPLGLAGSIAGHMAIPQEKRDAWRWFRWLLPLYLLSVAVFFVVDRYRAPALILCAVSSGLLVCVRRPAGSSRVNRSLLAAAGVGLATLVGGVIPLPFHLGEGDADTRMALHAIESGKDDEARAWLSRAVARHQAPGLAWFRAGLAWQSRNQAADAERALREAHRLDPDVGDVAFALAELLLTQGKGEEAVPLLERAEAANVRPDRVRLDLALALWQAGDRERARTALAGRVPAAGLPLLRARALASVEARQGDLAEWLLTEHRRYAANDAEVAEKLGLVKAARGDSRSAAALFEEAATIDPARATARFNLAIARLQQGRRDEAIALLREALRIDPSYAQAAGALRELLAGER